MNNVIQYTDQQYADSLRSTIGDMFTENELIFYATIIMLIQTEFVNDDKIVPTLGVGIFKNNVKLLINKNFWSSVNLKNINQKFYVLAHETLHVMYSHFITNENYSDKQLYNIACDLWINSCLNETLHESSMPGCGVTKEWNDKWQPIIHKLKEDFDNGIINKEKLAEELKKIPIRGCHADDYEQFSSQDCINNGSDWIYNQLTKLQKPKTDYMELCDVSGLGHPSNHKDWDKSFGNDLSKGEEIFVQDQIEYLLKNAEDNISSTDIGNVPGYIKDLLKKIKTVKKPVFNYSQFIRNWTRTFGNYTRIIRTRSKPNLIIQDGYRLKFAADKHILCALDTSGSMSNKDLTESLIEMFGVKRVTNMKISVTEVDTVINDVWEMKNLKQINTRLETVGISGRGGTSFEPVIRYLEDNHQYSGVIYFTDGHLGEPSKLPKVPLLVVCTSNGKKVKWKNVKSIKIPKGYYNNKNK